jgi:alkylation response protein AidB-like acyl-CoA dehydrogenase
MTNYTAPIKDMQFVLDRVVGLSKLPEHPDFGALDIDTVSSILEPAAQLAGEVLSPLNVAGDKTHATLNEGAVTTSPGFKEGYRQYCEGGWNSVVFDQAHGGQGLPWLVAFAVNEMWQGANMAFGLCPLLNQGAIEAIEAHASEELKHEYLPNMISGAWTGTMNLTEPQAGSDLAAVRTKAERAGDGTYRIFGQKIFITYGEHDYTDNIVHLVLARLPDAPEGVKGISLFIVPKFLKDGNRNDLKCTGLEHKLGIHGSPTCTMQFGDVMGDKGGAIGYLVGQENEGLKYMFTMMNNARLSVGLQGVAIAEMSYQHALAYAKDRVQGASLSKKDSGRVTISEHADVKRMLLSMKSQIEAFRALAYEAALNLDLAKNGDEAAQAKVDLLTPLVKAGGTDMSLEVTSTGVQIHGGMGFIEETGAAQYYRDARILPIYEGTNGIQAADLIFRKILRDQGAVLKTYLKECADHIALLQNQHGDDMEAIRISLEEVQKKIGAASSHLTTLAGEGMDELAAISVPFQKGLSLFAGGIMMARSAIAANEALAQGEDPDFMNEKLISARFYAESILPMASAHMNIVLNSAKTIVSAAF